MKDDLRRKLKAAEKRRRKRVARATENPSGPLSDPTGAAGPSGEKPDTASDQAQTTAADAVVEAVLDVESQLPINNAAVLSGCRAFLRASDPKEDAAERIAAGFRRLAGLGHWSLGQVRAAVEDLRKQAEQHCHDDDQSPDSLVVLMRITRTS